MSVREVSKQRSTLQTSTEHFSLYVEMPIAERHTLSCASYDMPSRAMDGIIAVCNAVTGKSHLLPQKNWVYHRVTHKCCRRGLPASMMMEVVAKL